MYPTIHITLPSYAVLASIGGFAVVLFLYFRIEKYLLSFADFLKMFCVSIVCGFVGSRVIYLFSRLSWLLKNFSVQHLISTVIGGGLVFYGGLLGVLLGIHIYCKKHNISSKNIYNMIAPAIPLFHFFGRIGCFMSGCCYGVELKSAINLFGVIQFDRIPTQLIEALFEVLLFVVLLVLQRKNDEKDYLKVYMITYAIFRFLIEFLRGDTIRGFYFGLSTSQIIALSVLAFYFILKIKAHKKSLTD